MPRQCNCAVKSGEVKLVTRSTSAISLRPRQCSGAGKRSVKSMAGRISAVSVRRQEYSPSAYKRHLLSPGLPGLVGTGNVDVHTLQHSLSIYTVTWPEPSAQICTRFRLPQWLMRYQFIAKCKSVSFFDFETHF